MSPVRQLACISGAATHFTLSSRCLGACQRDVADSAGYTCWAGPCFSLLSGLLQQNPDKRLGFDEVFAHSWLGLPPDAGLLGNGETSLHRSLGGMAMLAPPPSHANLEGSSDERDQGERAPPLTLRDSQQAALKAGGNATTTGSSGEDRDLSGEWCHVTPRARSTVKHSDASTTGEAGGGDSGPSARRQTLAPAVYSPPSQPQAQAPPPPPTQESRPEQQRLPPPAQQASADAAELAAYNDLGLATLRAEVIAALAEERTLQGGAAGWSDGLLLLLRALAVLQNALESVRLRQQH